MFNAKEFLTPHCHICNKPVESMEWEHDFMSNEIIITVHCHGDKESCRLDNQIRIWNSIEPGVAFSIKRIDETKRIE